MEKKHTKEHRDNKTNKKLAMPGFNLCPQAAATEYGAEVYNLFDDETDVRHAASFQPVGPVRINCLSTGFDSWVSI